MPQDLALQVSNLLRRPLLPIETKHVLRMVLQGVTNPYDLLQKLQRNHNLGIKP